MFEIRGVNFDGVLGMRNVEAKIMSTIVVLGSLHDSFIEYLKTSTLHPVLALSAL